MSGGTAKVDPLVPGTLLCDAGLERIFCYCFVSRGMIAFAIGIEVAKGVGRDRHVGPGSSPTGRERQGKEGAADEGDRWLCRMPLGRGRRGDFRLPWRRCPSHLRLALRRRSEERRVGKEGRSRCARDHSTKPTQATLDRPATG